MTFNLPLAQIDAAHLETLKADAIREERQLQYKPKLPLNTEDYTITFLS
jgi:hypothetical protein